MSSINTTPSLNIGMPIKFLALNFTGTIRNEIIAPIKKTTFVGSFSEMVVLTQPSLNSHRIAMLRLMMGPRLSMQINLNQVFHCMPMVSNTSNKLSEVSCTTHVHSITNYLVTLVKLACRNQPPTNVPIIPSHNYSIMLPPIPATVLSIGPVIRSLLSIQMQDTSMSERHVSVSVPISCSHKMIQFHATMTLSLPLYKLSSMSCPQPSKLNSPNYFSQPKIWYHYARPLSKWDGQNPILQYKPTTLPRLVSLTKPLLPSAPSLWTYVFTGCVAANPKTSSGNNGRMVPPT